MSSHFSGLSKPEREKSHFPTPFVYRDGARVSLHFQINEVQSTMDEEHPEALVLNYTRLMMGVLLFVPQPRHLGCIGLGGGSIPKYCYRHLPQTQISVAEINPEVIALREEFHVPRDDYRFGVFQCEGSEFLAAHPNTFDILMIDAFDLYGQPAHLCSREFYRTCFKALTTNGYLAVNLCHAGTNKAIERIEGVFGRQACLLRDLDGRNVIVIVGKEDNSYLLPTLPVRARVLEMTHPLYFREIAYVLIDEPHEGSRKLGYI